VLERGARQMVFNLVFTGPSRFGAADDAATCRRLAPWRQQVVLAAAYSTSEHGGLVEAIPGRAWMATPWPISPGSIPCPWPTRRRGDPTPLPNASVGIDFSGPAAALPQVPAWQVLQQAEGFWRGRTMLIGATVMEALGFQPLPSPLAWLLLGGWTLLVAGTLRRGGQVGTSVAITGALLVAGLLAAGGIWAVAYRLPPMSALVAMPLLGGGLRSWSQWRQESRERAYLRQVLSRRVFDPDQPGPAGAPAGPPGGDPPRLASAQGSSGSRGGLRFAGIAQKPPEAGPPPAPGVAGSARIPPARPAMPSGTQSITAALGPLRSWW